jgi:hypothetical protein
MKTINFILLALVAIYLLATPLALGKGGLTAKATGGNEQQVTALTDQLIKAFLKGDNAFFDKNSTDDYTAIHSDGRLTTKAEELDAFKSGALKYEAIDLRERKVRVYGNTALVITLSSSKGTLNGKPFSGEFRTTRTYVKQGGNWKMVAFQATRAHASQ